MTTSAHKVRLVVGLFGTAEEFMLALAELGAGQLKPGQIRTIAQVQALDGALQAWPMRGQARGFGAWIVCRPAEGPFPWFLTTVDPGPPDPTALQDVRALFGLHHWATRRQAQQLDSHLRVGGALLLVEPDTDAEERAACTVLLRHASGGVQTHEIPRRQLS